MTPEKPKIPTFTYALRMQLAATLALCHAVWYRLNPWLYIRCNACGNVQRGGPGDYCEVCGHAATVEVSR